MRSFSRAKFFFCTQVQYTFLENQNNIIKSISFGACYVVNYYKGVYVDLDGVYVDGLNIDVDGDGDVDTNDKINVISKFADRDGKFTYDEDGNAISTTLTESELENLQPVGYDIVDGIENVKGSSYNDTIYGNALVDNILSGLGGSDTLDGRGGNNTLLGGDGYDTLIAGSGNDYIDGGGDTDTLSYENGLN